MNSKTKIRFDVSYDGTDFCGWQKQKHGPVKSVAHTIEIALEQTFKEKIILFASGRTDAGVHAVSQTCHFEVSKPESFFLKFNLSRALQSKLPRSILIKDSWVAPSEFHATISATHKTYKYYISHRAQRPVFLGRYCEWVRQPLDIEYLNKCCDYLVGEHDFKSFQSVGTPITDTVREVQRARWFSRKNNVLEFQITGNGFLKQMVRNIVGTMLMLHRKHEKPEKIKEIIDLRNRSFAGPPAPPQGLFLWKVYYPLELDNKCRKL